MGFDDVTFKGPIASSKRSDSGERCEVKKAMKSRGGLGREVALLFTSHRSPLSERLEQARPCPLSSTPNFLVFVP